MARQSLNGRALWAAALVVTVVVIGAGLVAANRLGVSLVRRDATWAQMQDRATFRVGMDPSFPPFENLNDDGAPVGYDVDLAAALAKKWGMELEVVAIGYDSLMDALRAAKVDAIISAMPFDERLTRDVNFSRPYFDAGIRLAVPAGSSVSTLEDLAGKRVAVEWGSAGDMIARKAVRDTGIALEIVQYDTPEALLDAAATSNQVDAALVDAVSLRLAQGRGAVLQAVGPTLESNPYVVVSPRRAWRLAEEISAGLTSLATDGQLEQLELRWFGPKEGGN